MDEIGLVRLLSATVTGVRRFADGQPFTRAEFLAAGGPPAALAAYRRLLRGVYVGAEAPADHLTWVRAALLAAPTAEFATHHTAAALLGSWPPETAVVHLGTTAGRQSRVTGVRLHRYAVRPPLVSTRRVRCTSAEQTFLDLAEVLELVDLVVVGDGLVQAGHVTPAGLVTAAQGSRGRGARSARSAAALVRAGVESAMESRVRLLFVLAGLPEPQVNATVALGSGRRYRLDLSWPQLRVAVEYDGRHHIEREGQWQGDLRRREELEGDGWRIVVLTGVDLYRTPEATVQRTLTALRQAGMPPIRLREDWRRHFLGTRRTSDLRSGPPAA